jgi:hypothetical protein
MVLQFDDVQVPIEGELELVMFPVPEIHVPVPDAVAVLAEPARVTVTAVVPADAVEVLKLIRELPPIVSPVIFPIVYESPVPAQPLVSPTISTPAPDAPGTAQTETGDVPTLTFWLKVIAIVSVAASDPPVAWFAFATAVGQRPARTAVALAFEFFEYHVAGVQSAATW